MEEARLLAFETFQAATDEDLAAGKQVLPIAIILTTKRCGTMKARAVVLGNLDRTGGLESFAPVVSQGANRLLMASGARDGDYMIPFDLDSAFLGAELDRLVLYRLPDV